MLSDIQIAQQTEMWHIRKIAESAGVAEEYLEQYGNYKAKIDLSLLNTAKPDGKLVLVTAITPTPAGEGKTTTTCLLYTSVTLLQKVAQDHRHGEEQHRLHHRPARQVPVHRPSPAFKS